MRFAARICMETSLKFAIIFFLMLCLVGQLSSWAEGPSTAEASTSSSLPDAPQAPSPPQAASATDDSWHLDVAPYAWLPGVFGTVGIRGHEASVHVTGSDLLSNFNGGFAGFVEARKERFVLPIDLAWTRVATTKALPENDLTQTAVRAELGQVIFTPKVGYRIADTEHFKADALIGIRYWHEGPSLTFRPSQVNFSESGNWVDGLGGADFRIYFTPKAWITISGDAGGGGANLDYQLVGLLNFQPKPLLGFFAGWRYLDIDYQSSHRDFVYDLAQSGPLIGLNFQFGGKPPIPPSATCSASPAEVWSGEPVTATMTAQNFNPKHTLSYSWTGRGAKISGTGTTGNVDTTGLAPGNYSVTGTATDAKEKKNNVASCNANFTIKQPQPPTASCSANPTTIAVGEPSTITMSATDPQGWPLSYKWSSTGGQFTPNGTTATVTATNADQGNTITVTGIATDDRANLSASCTASINVPRVIGCVNIEDRGECTFEKNPKKPWRVDNDCKDVLDRLALQLQQMPNGKLDIVGFTDEQESIDVQTLGSQRSVNVKYYLTTDGPTKLDSSKIQPRAGGKGTKATHFYFVPEGNLCGGQLEVGAVVDETQVQPQSRNAPAPKKKAKSSTSAPPTQ
jgi:hypothetical protein